MSVTALVLLEAGTTAELQAQIATKIGEGYQPFGFPLVHSLNGSPEQTRIALAMIQGSQVLVGATGATGPTGATGSAGAAGATGSAGAAGAAGSQATFGSGAPSDGSGANGDVYTDIVAGAVYKKAAGTWGSPQVTFTVA